MDGALSVLYAAHFQDAKPIILPRNLEHGISIIHLQLLDRRNGAKYHSMLFQIVAKSMAKDVPNFHAAIAALVPCSDLAFARAVMIVSVR